jgi:hypothetical protein
MIAKISHAEDKEAKNTLIIGMYVPTRFLDTTKESINDIPGRPALPSVKLEHRDAPIGFYLEDNDIKMLFFKKE